MKTGIYFWFGYNIDYTERLKLIKEASFDSIMLWWGDEFEDYKKIKRKLPDLAANYGLSVENIHAPIMGTNTIWLDNANSLDILKKYEKAILDCSALEIHTVVLHVTDNKPDFAPTTIGLERFKKLVDIAEKNSVNIAIENNGDAYLLEYLFSNIKSDRMGFCYDSGHENCYNRGYGFLDVYHDKIFALHLHDNNGTDDFHAIPGDGNINWNSISNKIKKIGYGGAISLEVIRECTDLYSDINADEFLKKANSRVREIFLEE